MGKYDIGAVPERSFSDPDKGEPKIGEGVGKKSGDPFARERAAYESVNTLDEVLERAQNKRRERLREERKAAEARAQEAKKKPSGKDVLKEESILRGPFGIEAKKLRKAVAKEHLKRPDMAKFRSKGSDIKFQKKVMDSYFPGTQDSQYLKKKHFKMRRKKLKEELMKGSTSPGRKKEIRKQMEVLGREIFLGDSKNKHTKPSSVQQKKSSMPEKPKPKPKRGPFRAPRIFSDY